MSLLKQSRLETLSGLVEAGHPSLRLGEDRRRSQLSSQVSKHRRRSGLLVEIELLREKQIVRNRRQGS